MRLPTRSQQLGLLILLSVAVVLVVARLLRG
jgi:hypothetical protein